MNKHYMSDSSSSQESVVPIPDEIESKQTLVFMGMSDRAAEATFQRFQLARTNMPDEELLGFAKGTVRRGNDAVDDDDNWDDAMTSMGVGVELRRRILNPKYDEIRKTQTAMHWVLETMTDLWDFLLTFSPQVDNPNLFLRFSLTFNPQMDNPELRLAGPVSLASPMEPSNTTSSSSMSKMKQTPSKTSGKPETLATTSDRAPKAGETILFKGGALHRLRQAVNFYDPNGPANNLDALFSTPPTDFSRNQAYWYFTKQESVAAMYADYSRTRVGEERIEAGILSVVVPNDLLSEVLEIFGSDFKEFVWHNRLGLKIPQRLAYYAEAEALIGPILSVSTSKVQRMASRGETFNELELLRLSTGDSATRFCFQSVKLVEKMNERGRIWVMTHEEHAEK